MSINQLEQSGLTLKKLMGSQVKKRRPSTRRLELQTADRLLLKYLCEFGYLTSSQISDLVLCRQKKKTLRRLAKLREYGLVRLTWRRDDVGSRVYIPIMKKIGAAVDNETIRRAQNSKASNSWQNGNHRHEDLVRKVALKVLKADPKLLFDLPNHVLSNESHGSFYSDQERENVPDIIFYSEKDSTIAVELELHQKSDMRNLRKIYNFRKWNLDLVIYIVDEPAVGKSILRAYEKLTAPQEGKERIKIPLLQIWELSNLDSKILETFAAPIRKMDRVA